MKGKLTDRLVNSMEKHRLGYRMERQTDRQACEQDGRKYLGREGSEKVGRTNKNIPFFTSKQNKIFASILFFASDPKTSAHPFANWPIVQPHNSKEAE
jgi:hypothetical protein